MENYEVLDTMSLDELGDVVKAAMSRIYNKLRDEEGFGYDQHASFTSFGENEYDVGIVIMDGVSHNPGLDWPKSWWI